MNTAKLLLSENLITNSQYKSAYSEYQKDGKSVGYHLIQRKLITSEELVRFQSDRLGMKKQPRSALANIPKDLLEKITSQLAHACHVIPMSKHSNVLALGMTDPVDNKTMDIISKHTAMVIRPLLISEDDMSWALDQHYSDGSSPGETMPRLPQSGSAPLNDEHHPRNTMSWGVTIEDALTNAIQISSADSTAPVSYTSPARSVADSIPAPLPEEDFSIETTHSETTHSEPPSSTSAQSDEHLGSLPPLLEHMLTPQGERPTVIPESIPPAVAPLESGGGLDSWTVHTPTTQPQNSAESALQTFHSIPPNPSIMTARMTLLPPHKVHMRTEGELLHEILTTDNLDELISLALEYILRFAARALFLVVRKNEIRGYHVAGEYTSREAVRTFWIPFNQRSTLGQVALSGTTYLGPIGEKPADAVFCAALGGRPSHALLIPVIVKRRTVGILFADNVRTQQIAWPRLNRLTEAIASSLARIITREKQQQRTPPP